MTCCLKPCSGSRNGNQSDGDAPLRCPDDRWFNTHQGRIAEMRTGEGKTLVATLAAYLNALSGEGVHVITVNDYLAGAMPSGWGLYRALG